MKTFACILPVLAIIGVNSQDVMPGEICPGNCTIDSSGMKSCRFTTVVDFFASEWGYYGFKECGNMTNPTLAVEAGATYYFDQTDSTNWYNPIGFSYFPDGFHEDVDELDPVIPPPGTASSCNNDASCPAAMYLIDDAYLGDYSNNPTISPVTNNRDNHGLEEYMAPFFLPYSDWSLSNYTATLFLDVSVRYMTDIFYFSKNHNKMSGRIKVMAGGMNVTGSPIPPMDYDYVEHSDYDSECGTTDISETQLPMKNCPDRFVCNVPEGNPDLVEYAGCYESMNCKMVLGMTTKTRAKSEIALFIHQMIPHHQNAINMAKTLWKSDYLQCDDEDEESDDCVMQQLLHDIIAKQNRQVQEMEKVLYNKNLPDNEYCDLSAYASKDPTNDETDDEGGAERNAKALSLILSFVGIVVFLS